MKPNEQLFDGIKLDFDQARAKHLLFKTRLRSILYGAEIDEAPVVSQFECTVGKWIYGHALADYAHIPEMQKLEEVHAELHTSARELVERYKEGKIEEARMGLEGIENIADKLTTLLWTVETKVQKSPSKFFLRESKATDLNVNLHELNELQKLNLELDKRIREQSKELYQAKERFELVAKATQDVVWDWDLINNRIWWNESFKTLFGYKEEEIEPGIESWYNRLHPEDKERVVKGIHNVIEHGEKQWFAEYRFRKADGTYATVYDRAYALYNTEGKPCRMVGSIADITQRKETEIALAESEKNFRRMILQAPVAICIFSGSEYVVEILNSRMEELLGRKAEYLQGKPFFETMPEVREQGLEPVLEGIIKNKSSFIAVEREFKLPRAGILKRVFVTFIYEPLFDKEGGISGIMVVATEVTDQVLARQKLEESEIELQKRVDERTFELERKNDQLEQFTYAASHDLQEPLRKISLFLGRLLSNIGSALDEENQRIAERIQSTVGGMKGLINDLLNYSSTSLGTTDFEEVDLTAIVQGVISDMEAAIIETNAKIELQPLPSIQGDKRQLMQLFQNLIGNAIKYHKQDEAPEVHIQAHIAESKDIEMIVKDDRKSNGFYKIQVQDNGIGFGQEFAEQIFKLFHRLHRKSEYQGTGVGLAIVQKVVDNHEGYIRSESKPGEGATFKVFLPI